MSSHRILQINELIRHELSGLILAEVEFPKDCLVTIMDVQASKDLRHAKIWLSIIPGSYTGQVLSRLDRNIGHLQFLLNQKLSIKPLPRISFVIDDTEAEAAGIEVLLDKIKEK